MASTLSEPTDTGIATMLDISRYAAATLFSAAVFVASSKFSKRTSGGIPITAQSFCIHLLSYFVPWPCAPLGVGLVILVAYSTDLPILSNLAARKGLRNALNTKDRDDERKKRISCFNMTSSSSSSVQQLFESMGPTTGYVAGFLVACILESKVFSISAAFPNARLGLPVMSVPVVFFLFAIGEMTILLFGCAWLSYVLPTIDPIRRTEEVAERGLKPFWRLGLIKCFATLLFVILIRTTFGLPMVATR